MKLFSLIVQVLLRKFKVGSFSIVVLFIRDPLELFLKNACTNLILFNSPPPKKNLGFIPGLENRRIIFLSLIISYAHLKIYDIKVNKF